MLRITVEHNVEAVVLRLEGKLIEQWVEEAGKVWEEIAAGSGTQTVVDLARVSFVDSQGRHLLGKMSRAGAKLTGSGPMMHGLIEEIEKPRPRQRQKRILISVLLALTSLLISCVAMAQDGLSLENSAPLLTLEDAVRLAVDNNRTVQVRSLDVLKTDDEIAILKTRRLPSTNISVLGSQLLNEIGFTFEKGAFGDFPATGPIPNEDTTITTPRRPTAYLTSRITQPLSGLYKIKLGIHQAELSRELAKESLREQKFAVANNVKRLYYSAIETQSALEAIEESVRFYREMDRLTGEYVLQQVALRSDNLDVKAALMKEQYEALTLQNTLLNRKEQLNQLMGRDVRTEFRLEAVPLETLVEADLQSAQFRALEQRPEVHEARLKQQQAEQEWRIQKAENIPDVNLSFQYISPFGVDVLPKNIATLGVQVSWEPWDWGRKKSELQSKSRSIEQAKLAVRESETAVLIEVNQLHRQLGEARELLQVAEMGREAVREKLRVIQARYSEQAALLKDVLQAQSAVADANHSYRQALLSYWTARADFEKALGEQQ